MPKDNDLFLANKLGNIKKRLSKNPTGYNGEAKVSPNGEYVVYTSYDTSDPADYELYKVKADGSGEPKRVSFKKSLEKILDLKS